MRSDSFLKEGYDKALALIRKATVDKGILASLSEAANYKRIWARDAIIAGLAVLPTGDQNLIAGLGATLQTLANAQTPDGNIPNNVQTDSDGDIVDVSYGGICGRVDSVLWFVIGVCNYIQATHDKAFADQMTPNIERALALLSIWEYNGRGLIYVPQSGDWADEFLFHGYVLLEQVLRLWALRCYANVFNDQKCVEQASNLQELIRINYWPQTDHMNSDFVYHPRAYGHFLDEHDEPDYWLVALTPGGYETQFDAFSNALCILLNLSNSHQSQSILDFGQNIMDDLKQKMVPCFWPPIREDSASWKALQNNYGYKFSNYPYHYQNGGLWPMINGWWGLALHKSNRIQEAEKVLSGINHFNQDGLDDEEWGFYEYAHTLTGTPGGTKHLIWSAAGALLLQHGLENKVLFFGSE